MNKNLEKLNQILELIRHNTVTPKDLQEFLVLMLETLKKSKQNFDELSKENLEIIAESIAYIKNEGETNLKTLDEKSTKTLKKIEDKLSTISALVEEVRAMKWEKPRDGIDGEPGAPGKDGSPDTGEDIVDKINSLPVNEANQIDASHIKNLPEFKGSKGGSTARNLWQLQDYPLTTKGDIMVYDTAAARLPVGEDGQVLVADSGEDTGLRWEDPSFLSSVTYMFSGTASGVGSYYEMPALGTWVESTEASIVTAGVSTTPTLIASFITDSGSPGVTTLSHGTYHFHIETEKTAGSNNYYVYAELYKRTSGGTETLLLTSDSSSESAVNTRIQRDVDGLLSASETLSVTDRLVVKWYAVMLSSTATITTYFDNSTDARMELPASVVDASNFVRKSGDTMSGDLDMGGNDISNVSTIEIGSGATDTTLSRLSAGVLGVEGIEVPTISSTSTLTNKTIGNTNTVTLKDTLFTLQDDADTTKQAVFQLSGIATGTTRTYTLPNTSATIVVNSGNQTLTGQMTFSASTNSFGTGTGTGTQAFASGATVNGSTKTVNIGTSGASGSTTTITLGSSTSGATSTTTVYGTTSFQSLTDGNSNARVFYTGSTGGGAEIRGHNGFSATLPIYSFWYNNYTGLGNPASNVLSFIVNAVELGRFSGSNFTVTNGIELGHASDTTISRSAAGQIAVEGVVVPTISSTNTLTNKRVTKRVGSTTSSATPTINTDDVDCYKITALATAITSFTTNLSGTPTDFQELTIRIKDDGTARAITWGASFTNHGAILPTTTTISKTLTVKFIYDSVAAIWGCVSAVEEA